MGTLASPVDVAGGANGSRTDARENEAHVRRAADTANGRRCLACGEPLIEGRRVDARTCGQRCRQTLCRRRRHAQAGQVTPKPGHQAGFVLGVASDATPASPRPNRGSDA